MGAMGDRGSPVGSHQGVFTASCLRRRLWLQERGWTGRSGSCPYKLEWRPQQAVTSVGCRGAPGGPGQSTPERLCEARASTPTQMTAVGGGAGVPSGPELTQQTQGPGRPAGQGGGAEACRVRSLPSPRSASRSLGSPQRDLLALGRRTACPLRGAFGSGFWFQNDRVPFLPWAPRPLSGHCCWPR